MTSEFSCELKGVVGTLSIGSFRHTHQLAVDIFIPVWCRKWCQSKSWPHIPIRVLHTHHRPILHRFGAVHTRYRQTDTDLVAIGETQPRFA